MPACFAQDREERAVAQVGADQEQGLAAVVAVSAMSVRARLTVVPRNWVVASSSVLRPASASTLVIDDVVAGDDRRHHSGGRSSRDVYGAGAPDIRLTSWLRNGHGDRLTGERCLQRRHKGGRVGDGARSGNSACSQGGSVETRQEHASSVGSPSESGPECDAESVTRREGGACPGASCRS